MKTALGMLGVFGCEELLGVSVMPLIGLIDNFVAVPFALEFVYMTLAGLGVMLLRRRLKAKPKPRRRNIAELQQYGRVLADKIGHPLMSEKIEVILSGKSANH